MEASTVSIPEGYDLKKIVEKTLEVLAANVQGIGPIDISKIIQAGRK